ncbi:MAG: proprotein convertase P-domain-containing protein [Fluviicola sp.]|nr:proprotein convertase P-domain-containing protein [Fluviicola sp.]
MKTKLLHLGAWLLIASSFSMAYSQLSKGSKGPWRMVNESSIPASGTRYIHPTNYLTFKLDVAQMQEKLALAKRIDDPTYLPVFIDLPKPDGSSKTYQVQINETMSPGLMEQFPEIRAYDAVATDNSGEIVKLDLTPQGFHAMIMVPGGSSIFIDPFTHLGDTEHYIVYAKKDFVTDKEFTCDFENQIPTEVEENGVVKSYGNCTKRTYRLALTATGEYTAFHGGTVVLAQAAQVTTMNRVNGVYMRDIAVTLTIIANNNLLIYTNAGSDPYTNGNPGTMITQNQTNVTTVIGSANYDIGHVFGTNSGGLAGLGVVCSSSNKARGVTGSGAPIGDPFDIDYVAHEMGHQFSGNHTFAGNTGSCGGGNANLATGYEPGSGSTIMAYAGICSPNDIQPNSDDHFHTGTFIEIHTFLGAGGNSCAVSTAIPNQSAPTVTVAGGSYTIPVSTPFALTATATDPDGDALTYCWEQMNNNTTVNTPTATQTAGPNFRSRTPSTSPTRYFPALSSLTGGAASTFEVLPSVNRTFSFKCLVRDNEVGGGCNDEATVTLTTTTSAGPFIVNYPTATGITWPGNSTQTVTWSVANTNIAPVSCANVDVMISTNGGATFSVIADNVPNDGSQQITVPNTATTTAIVMVICENGTFFDVSNNVFAITAATNDYTLSLANTSISACQGSNGVYTVVVGQIGSYTDPVTLSATGIPAPATVNFSPNPATPGTSVTMTVSNTGTVAPGTYSFTVNGTSTVGPHSTTGTLVISTSGVTASTLNLPTNGDPSAAIQPTLTWTNAGAGVLYDVDIASDAAFTSMVENATGLSSATYTATTLLAGTTYYWRVNSYNSCSSPVLSSVFSFTTASCGNYVATTVPVAISATGTPTVTSTLTVPTNGTIDDINVVDLVGTHTYIQDLTITLTSPAGTVVTLFDQICAGENDFNLNLDDEATPGALPCPPVGGGSYQPSSVLSAFDGEAMNGTWTLTITDNANQDGGSLTGWALDICFTPTIPCTAPTAATLGGTTTICAGNSTTLSVTGGNLNDATDWQWYSGSCGGTSVATGTTFTTSTPGTYYVRGEGGCVTAGTCQSITVTQTTVNVATTLNAGVLSASQNGAQYQWLDCGNGNAPIAGQTAQTFTPTVNGNYAVQVTSNGCTDTSSCVAYNSVGIEDYSDVAIQLYPNPTTGLITVSFGIDIPVQEMNVTDVTGRLVRAEQAFTASSINIDLTKEAQGIYFMNIQIGGKIQTMKITKN